MPLTSRLRRVHLAPLALAAVVGGSGLAATDPVVLSQAAAAIGAEPGSASISGSAGTSGTGPGSPAAARPEAGAQAGPQATTAAYTFDQRTPQRVIPGFRLREKPPPWQLPVAGYHLTGRFGNVGLWASSHTGLDFAAPEGTPIRAIAPGTVVSVGYDGAFGEKTVVRLDDGTTLWFCHQSGTEVAAGQRVEPGQTIGYVGSTGNVTGPHLHLEVHPGGGDLAIDPEAWLTDKVTTP